MIDNLKFSTKDVILLYLSLFEKEEMGEDLYSIFLRLQAHLFDQLTIDEIQNLKVDYKNVIRRFP
ncbi:MAG: hypothetical protein A2Z96_07755 [Spirochaetes bacterium GWB1_48_6]|nr:MAG: hypothetical protein A2Z96_07755 [Spirochaetes bacterium GWB1_48_6]